MANEFGEYGASEIDFINEADGFWEISAREPNIPEGVTYFIVESYEKKYNEAKGSLGYNIVLIPYQDQYGLSLPLVATSSRVKKYLGVAAVDPVTKALYDTWRGNNFKAFMTSIGVGDPNSGKLEFNLTNVRGAVVKATVKWEKTLARNENPETGKVPEVIDDNDPYSYVIFAQVGDDIRGVRNEDGSVKKLAI